MSEATRSELKTETLKKLDAFIGSDLTGFACQAWDRMAALGVDMGRVQPVAQWTPAYAAGLRSGIESL